MAVIMLRRLYLALVGVFFSVGVFAAAPATHVIVDSPVPLPVSISTPIPVSVTVSPSAPSVPLQTDAVSVWLSNVTLGDLWALQFVLGLAQCALLGAIHGHQR
jgi:hypothetical protein